MTEKTTTLSRAFGAASSSAAIWTLVLAGCASAPPPPPPKPVAPPPRAVAAKTGDPLADANAVFGQGHYDEALRDYDALLRADPRNEAAAFNRAVTLQRLGK